MAKSALAFIRRLSSRNQQVRVYWNLINSWCRLMESPTAEAHSRAPGPPGRVPAAPPAHCSHLPEINKPQWVSSHHLQVVFAEPEAHNASPSRVVGGNGGGGVRGLFDRREG